MTELARELSSERPPGGRPEVVVLEYMDSQNRENATNKGQQIDQHRIRLSTLAPMSAGPFIAKPLHCGDLMAVPPILETDPDQRQATKCE